MFNSNFNSSVRAILKKTSWIVIALAVILFGCTDEKSLGFNEGLELYRLNQLEEALPYFEQAVAEDGSNPDAHAWLAETYRRLDRKVDAVNSARKALELDSCHSFAHTILAYALNPMYGKWEEVNSDSAWSHLLKAVACDSTDGNAWLAVWTEAIRRDDPKLEQKALSSFISTGILSPAIIAYNRWMLGFLPQNAILLTNGDMDTYPAVALQHVEDFRPDVAIVNFSLLNTTWYARYIENKYKIQLPFNEKELNSLKVYKDEDGKIATVAFQIMKEWLSARKSGTLTNPIAISVTVGDLSFAEDTKDHLCLMGAYRLWLPEPAESPMDISMIRKSLQGINPDDFSGSLVSEFDRSSVRISSTNRIVTNITDLALKYSRLLIESDRTAEALEMLTWAEQFEKNTVYGAVFKEQIDQLKETASIESE